MTIPVGTNAPLSAEVPDRDGSRALNRVPATAPASIETQQFRSQVGHITRQSGVFFAGTIFTAILGYLFKIYLARVLGAEALGIYALGITLVGLIGVFNTLGLLHSAVRYVAVYQASGKPEQLRALLWTGGAILLAANLFFAGVLLAAGRPVAIRFYHSPALVRYLPLFALLMLPNVLNSFYSRALQGYKDVSRRTLIMNVIGSPLTMALALVLIAAGLGLRGYILAQILSAVIVLVLLLAAVRTLTPQAARFSARHLARVEPEVWSFSASVLGIGLLEFLIVQADKISLGFYLGAREVGIYSVAAAMVAYVPLILHSVNQIFSPTIADLHARGGVALLGRLFQSLTKWVVSLTLPLAIVMIVFARSIMRIFGHDFEAGWPILVIGTAGQLVNCGVGSVGFLLLMSGNEKRLMKVQSVMSVVMVALCFALIPIWGIVGAAVGAAATNIGMNLWNLAEVRRTLRLSPYNRSYIHLILPTIVTLAGALALKRNAALFRHDWIAIGCAAVVAYLLFAAVAVAFGLDPDDRLIARAVWSRIRGMFGTLPAEVQP